MDWAAIAAVASTVVAVVALAFSVVSFRSQQRWAEKNARAGVKPFLWTKLQTYVDLKSIIIRNDGVGPARITRASFSRGDRTTSRVVDLFDLEIPYWETFTGISAGRVIPLQGEIVLLRQSLEHLVNQGIDRNRSLTLLEEWQAQQAGIHLHIEFEDIYGNPMIYERDL